MIGGVGRALVALLFLGSMLSSLALLSWLIHQLPLTPILTIGMSTFAVVGVILAHAAYAPAAVTWIRERVSKE